MDIIVTYQYCFSGQESIRKIDVSKNGKVLVLLDLQPSRAPSPTPEDEYDPFAPEPPAPDRKSVAKFFSIVPGREFILSLSLNLLGDTQDIKLLPDGYLKLTTRPEVTITICTSLLNTIRLEGIEEYSIHHLAIAEDIIALSLRDTIRLYQLLPVNQLQLLRTVNISHRLADDAIRTSDISPDRQRLLAFENSGTIAVWDLGTARPLYSFQAIQMSGEEIEYAECDIAGTAIFGVDANNIISIIRQPFCSVSSWIPPGNCMWTQKFRDDMLSKITISSDRRWLAAVGTGYIYIIDVRSGKIANKKALSSPVADAAFLSNNLLLVAYSRSLEVWELR